VRIKDERKTKKKARKKRMIKCHRVKDRAKIKSEEFLREIRI